MDQILVNPDKLEVVRLLRDAANEANRKAQSRLVGVRGVISDPDSRPIDEVLYLNESIPECCPPVWQAMVDEEGPYWLASWPNLDSAFSIPFRTKHTVETLK